MNSDKDRISNELWYDLQEMLFRSRAILFQFGGKRVLK
jgi:hypothetical protein